MNEPKKVLNSEQSALVAELTAEYGIEPEDILFFDDSAKPFLTYEAASALSNKLADLFQIGVEPVVSPFADSIAVKCTIVTKDGHERSAVGVANRAEKINDSDISDQQAINLASSRALRNVLRAAGIDLIKLHRQATGGELTDKGMKSNRTSLIGQAHKIGVEIGLIFENEKAPWRNVLKSRYNVTTSADLTEEQLSDLVAFLNTLKQPAKQAA
jgi:hypothetical protein